MTKTILGIFNDRSDVEQAIEKFQEEGYNTKDISIVMKDKEEAKDIGDSTGANVAGGALSGATTGAAIGGVAGFLAGTVLPGLGGFLIGGPIGAALGLTGAAASTVSGAATGAVAGGLLGALMGLGLGHDEAAHYESRVKEGAILLAVPTQAGEESQVTDIFNEFNASDVRTISQSHDTIEKKETRRTFADTEESGERVSQPREYAQHYAVGVKGGESAQSDKGWHGESKRHEVAAEKGHEKKSTSESKSASGKKGGKSTLSAKGKGWHGDSEHHAEARKGKEVHSSKK